MSASCARVDVTNAFCRGGYPTGNEGCPASRSYKTAVLVVWPRAFHVDIYLASGGSFGALLGECADALYDAPDSAEALASLLEIGQRGVAETAADVTALLTADLALEGAGRPRQFAAALDLGRLAPMFLANATVASALVQAANDKDAKLRDLVVACAASRRFLSDTAAMLVRVVGDCSQPFPLAVGALVAAIARHRSAALPEPSWAAPVRASYTSFSAARRQAPSRAAQEQPVIVSGDACEASALTLLGATVVSLDGPTIAALLDCVAFTTSSELLARGLAGVRCVRRA